MKKVLALCEVSDEYIFGNELSPGDVNSISPIPGISSQYYPDIRTFLSHWAAGVDARRNWEIFSENFFRLFTESGIVDEHGVHIEEYDMGSICRFILDNRETMFSASFREQTIYNLLIPPLKIGAMSMRKGKEIKVDWPKIAEYAKPMAEVVLKQVAKSPERRVVMKPVLEQYFKENPPTDNQPSSAN